MYVSLKDIINPSIILTPRVTPKKGKKKPIVLYLQ